MASVIVCVCICVFKDIYKRLVEYFTGRSLDCQNVYFHQRCNKWVQQEVHQDVYVIMCGQVFQMYSPQVRSFLSCPLAPKVLSWQAGDHTETAHKHQVS